MKRSRAAVTQSTGLTFQAAIAKIVREFTSTRVDVGVSADTAKPVPAGEPGVVEYAAINEFGREKSAAGPRIPERSFLRDTLKINRAKYTKALKGSVTRTVGQVSKGEPADADRALGRIGETVRGDILRRIAEGILPENTPYTIAKKTRGKGGKTTTLIDSGRLRQSIAWKLSKEGQ